MARRCTSTCSIRQNDYKRPNGQIYHTYPSLKTEEDQKALWQATANNTIHCIATDELCCTLKDKTVGSRIDDTTGGNSGVEPRLGVMYTEMVARRGYSLSQYVDLVSSNAAKIMGLYPRKERSPPRATPTSLSSIPPGAGKYAPLTCTRPTTPLGRATTSSPGRS